MKTIYYVFQLTFTISRSRSCSKIKCILKNKNKFKVENFKCPILESNSGPLDLQSDALPVELSIPLTF